MKTRFTINIVKEEIEFLESLLDDFNIEAINKRIEFLEGCRRLFIEKRKVFDLMDQYMFNDTYKAVKELIKDEITEYDKEEDFI